MFCLPQDIKQEELLDLTRAIGWEVSRILKAYNQDIETNDQFQRKLKILNLESGPVTSADIEISELIKKRIKDKYPHIKWDFLSEEDVKDNQKLIFKSKWVWIIDPLDGTKAFIEQNGEYAMHLALAYEREIILSVVPIPSKNQLWMFFKDKGTWFETPNNKENLIIPTTPKDLHIHDLTIVTSKSHVSKEFERLLEELSPKKVLRLSSVGFKVVSILSGEANLYISYTSKNGSCPKDWDMAAPFGLIKGAGGNFTDIYSNDLAFLKDDNFEQRGILIASLNQNHQEVCKEILDLAKI